MVFKYKYAAKSPLIDQNKNTQYMVVANDFENGFDIFDDLSITKLAEVVKMGETYKIYLFGNLYTTIDQNLNPSKENLKIFNTDSENYTFLINENTTATLTLQNGSVNIDTDDMSKLVLSLAVALVIALKTKNKTAEKIDSPVKKQVKKDYSKALVNLKNKLKTKGAEVVKNVFKTNKNKLGIIAISLSVILIILGACLTFLTKSTTKGVYKTSALVSSNGQKITFKVNATDYSFKPTHTESANTEITIYYTLKSNSQVENIYFSKPLNLKYIPVSATGVGLLLGTLLVVCVKRRKASTPSEEH